MRPGRDRRRRAGGATAPSPPATAGRRNPGPGGVAGGSAAAGGLVVAGDRGASVRGAGPGAGRAVRVGQPASQQPRRLGCWPVLGWLQTSPATAGSSGGAASGAEDQRDWRLLPGPVGGRAGAAGRPTAAPGPRAAGADLRRCDPAQPGTGCCGSPRHGTTWPPRWPAPATRRRSPSSPRCAHGPNRTANRAAGADQRRDHHGREGREPVAAVRVGDCLELLQPPPASAPPTTAPRRKPAVLSAAARARRARPGRARPRSRCSPAVGNPAASS